jgi:anti-sigma B factor antagonist
MERFKSEVCLENERAIVFLRGELDISAEERLGQLLSAVMDDGWDVDLDLERVSFIDSTGLHVLLTAQRAAHDRGLRVSIVNASTCVERILELTNTGSLLLYRQAAPSWNPFADSTLEPHDAPIAAHESSG